MPILDLQLEKIREEKQHRNIKCVVWDLDNTLWQGVLLEDGEVVLAPEAERVVRNLDSRGILQSIASKNDYEMAMAKLRAFGLAEYFLYPEIHFSAKSESVRAIAQAINIGLDSIAFIDDQPFEREEVSFVLPDVLTLDAMELGGLLDRSEFKPRFITEDSRIRRSMYLSDIARNTAEKEFSGAQDEFLATLEMKFTLRPAREEDLKRAEELTLRTHQLNTTGYTYSYEELDGFRQSSDHKLLVASLTDKFGTYGKIGLALVECGQPYWTLKLLLMSCRVMSRGVGTIMINHILQLAKQAGVRLRAEFISTSRNRMMYITYKFGNFNVVEERDGLTVFENDCSSIQGFPPYVEVHILD